MRRSHLIGMALAMLVAGCGGDGTAGTSSLPAAAAAATTTSRVVTTSTAAIITATATTAVSTTTTTTTVTASSLAWSRAPDDSIFGEEGVQRMWGVTAGGPGLVAVGKDGGGAGEWVAAVWTSIDGITWSRVPHDEAVFGDGDRAQEINAVTVGGPGLVAVGHTAGDLAVWTSVDGIAWSRAPDDEPTFGGLNVKMMRSVTAGGPGLVAVGSVGSGGTQDAAVWTSVDGITWSRVPHDEAIFGGDAAKQGMWSVTAGGPGLVAVGSDLRRGGRVQVDTVAAVWTSVDGITWSRVPHDEAIFGAAAALEMRGVTAGGPGLVAVGQDSSGARPGVVWTSVDGITWSRVPHDEAAFGGDGTQVMWDVVAGGPGLVAVGWDEGGARDAVVWTSVDGITWSRVHNEAVFGGDGTQAALAVTVGGPDVVAVGGDLSGGDWDAAVWVWTAASRQ